MTQRIEQINTPLSPNEFQEFAQHEAIVKEGLQTFYDIGEALLTIRDKRLYRAEFNSFEEYCQEKWGFVRRQADRLIQAFEVTENLRPVGLTVPHNEAQARPLAKLEPEKQRQAWQKAVEMSPDGKPTSKQVKQAVNAIIKQEESQETVELPQYTPSTPTKKEATNLSINAQFHAKLMWNYQRMGLQNYQHFTMGYAQRTWEQVSELLRLANVSVLVDIRRNAISSDFAFNKESLSTNCAELGITYLQLPELGIDSEESKGIKTVPTDKVLYDSYIDSLGNKGIISIIERNVPLHHARVVFMDIAVSPIDTLRNRIALALEEIHLQIFDL
ncbi:DUF488 domain-containing protein [Beggiatoa leptomitoformis]|uniref:DUF488 family protein n=1 Tax=Beggiatoa leptomitoformis TaxID=288004 RepID=A0A2N9YCE2_9GAMM|nr:DUF488 domain-containing protein [Beggiatoa leptomitoformis]AUI68133.1 DUF488 family protein [Beggiatoa leptomitoformis]QGX03446.1 DUF488 family protein [Beggiatoa leptomitoformis]